MSLFDASSVSSLRTDRLLLLGNYVNQSLLTDDYLLSKLQSAETDASQRLRVLFEPTWMFSGDPTQTELDAIGDDVYSVEPAYDYDPEMFMGDRWGMLTTRQRPIISVQSMTFIYPIPIDSTFVVPPEWLRVDRKYGQIQVVPTGMAMGSNVALFLLQTIGGGRQIPQMLELRYRAGLANAAAQYPNLIDTIKKMAVLRILGDSFVPQSGSISADGLSQSMSLDLSKYQDSIEKQLNYLYDVIHGVQFTVV